jgi:hypothetical protein
MCLWKTGTMSGRKRGPASIVKEIDFGTAELVPDSDHPGGWTVCVNGYPQSYVDMHDPTHLVFEYVRLLARIVDNVAGGGVALSVLHLGGAGLTLPRYIAATRPHSHQRVVEHDAALIALVRRHLPLPRNSELRIRAEDARTAVESTGPGRFHVVINDVFRDAQVPAHLSTTNYAAAVARVLRPDGVYAVNLADGPPLAFCRSQVATLRAVFADVCLLAEPGVLRGRRFGNIVLAAARSANRLPIAALASAASRDSVPARLVAGTDLDRFTAGAKPVGDAHAVDSSRPPAG